MLEPHDWLLGLQLDSETKAARARRVNEVLGDTAVGKGGLCH